MAKRDIESEPVDETPAEPDVPTAGERLRAARMETKVSLEDIAAQTRIPQRHLESIETAEWDKLPAATYTIGFAKSYASVVGLDRTEIGDQLREEMGGQRFANSHSEVIEAADPARTMPRWLVIGAIVAVILLVLLMTWINSRSLEQPAAASNNVTAAPQAAAPPAAPAPAPVAGQQVVITATQPVWFQVSQKGGTNLFSGMLQSGQTYAVPATATAPVLKTGKPEALRITVGNEVAPPVGPPAKTVTNVSLLPSDLMKVQQSAPPPTPAPLPKPHSSRAVPKPAASPPVIPAPATTTAPATTNIGD